MLKMENDNQILSKLHSVNNNLWEAIRSLHESQTNPDIKQKLIEVSGEICTELIIPLERKLESN